MALPIPTFPLDEEEDRGGGQRADQLFLGMLGRSGVLAKAITR